MYRLTITERQERISEERRCRKVARLVQVRQQAGQAAARTRQRVQAESARQVARLKRGVAAEYADEKENRLAQFEAEYSACLRQVGSAHLAAAQQPDLSIPRHLLAAQQNQVAAVRHQAALQRIRTSQRAMDEERRRCDTLRELNSALERVRADRVAQDGHRHRLQECRRADEEARRQAASQANAMVASTAVVYQSAFRPRVSFRDDASQTRPRPRCRTSRALQTAERGSLARDPTADRGSQTRALGRDKKTGTRFPDPAAAAAAATTTQTAPATAAGPGSATSSSRQPQTTTGRSSRSDAPTAGTGRSSRSDAPTAGSGRSSRSDAPTAGTSRSTVTDVPHSETALTPSELQRQLGSSGSSGRAASTPSGVPLTSEMRPAPDQYAVQREQSGYDARAAARQQRQEQEARASCDRLLQMGREQAAAARGRHALRRMSARSEYARLLTELEQLEVEERRDRRAGAGSAAQLARATSSLAQTTTGANVASYEERQKRLNQLFEDAILLASDADASDNSTEYVTPARDLAQEFDRHGHHCAELLAEARAAGGVAAGVQAVNQRRSQVARASLTNPPGTWTPAAPEHEEPEPSVYSSVTGRDQTSQWQTDTSAAAQDFDSAADGGEQGSNFADQEQNVFGSGGEDEAYPEEGDEEGPGSIFASGEEQSMFAGEEQGTVAGEEQSTFAGEEQSMFAGEEQSMFAGEEQSMFAGEEQSMFAGEEQSMFAGEEQSIFAEGDEAYQDPESLFTGDEDEQEYQEADDMYEGEEGESMYGGEPSYPEGPTQQRSAPRVYTGEDVPDDGPLMHVGPDGIYPISEPAAAEPTSPDVSSLRTADLSSLRTSDLSSMRTSDVSTARSSELSVLASDGAAGGTFDSANTAYQGVPGDPGDPALAERFLQGEPGGGGSHGQVRQYVSRLLEMSREQVSRLSQPSHSPSTVYGSASGHSAPSSLSRSQLEGDSTMATAASRSPFDSELGETGTSSPGGAATAAPEQSGATSGVYSEPSQSVSATAAAAAAAAASDAHMQRYSELMEKLSEVQERRDSLMRSYTSVADELRSTSAGDLVLARSSTGGRPRPPPTLSRTSADAPAPHELSTIQEGDTTGRSRTAPLDGSGLPAAAAPAVDATSSGSLLSRTAPADVSALADGDDTLSQLSNLTSSHESPPPGATARRSASEISLRSSALERALQASREAIRSVSGGGGGGGLGTSAASFAALSALSGSSGGGGGPPPLGSEPASPDVGRIISKLGMKSRSGPLAADPNLSSSSSGSAAEARLVGRSSARLGRTSGDELRRRVLSKAAVSYSSGSSSSSSPGSSSISISSSSVASAGSIQEVASGGSVGSSGMLVPLDLSAAPAPVSAADSSLDTDKFAAGAVGSTPMKRSGPPEGEPVAGLSGAVSMQPADLTVPGDGDED